MYSTPIAGNQDYTSVADQAANLSVLNVADVNATSRRRESVRIHRCRLHPRSVFRGGIIYNLNTSPGLPQATSLNDNNLLKVAAHAFPTSIAVVATEALTGAVTN